MIPPAQRLWRRAIKFALGETPLQRCAQLCLLLPALLWLRLRNSNAPWEGVLGKHIRAGRPLETHEAIKVQFWEAADLCCALLFLLVILSPWLFRWAGQKLETRSPHRSIVMTRRVVLWLCTGLALALVVRWPYFHRPILRDEQDTVRRNILGYLIADEPGKAEPVILDWETTLWEDSQANNPFLFSVLARFTLRTWQVMAGAEPWRLNLQVLRMWALAPGLLSLAALWWSLRRMGHSSAAWLALFIGALHPLHVDYSTQARGYALVMLFGSLSVGLAWLVMTEARWRNFIGLAGCFLGMLYANPASAYFVASLGGCLALCLGWRAFAHQDAMSRRSFARLAICGAAALLIFIPLIWPALPQAAGYLKKEMKGSIGGVWPVSAWSKYAVGVMMPDAELGRKWLNPPPDEAGNIPPLRSAFEFIAEQYVPDEPLLFGVVFVVVPALMIAGACAFLRQHKRMWPVLAGGMAAPLLGYAFHLWIVYTFIYYWYLIYALPVVLMLLGLGLESAGHALENRWRKSWLPCVPALGFTVLLLAVNPTNLGLPAWTQPRFTQPERFERGRFTWTTYPNGITVREPNPAGR